MKIVLAPSDDSFKQQEFKDSLELKNSERERERGERDSKTEHRVRVSYVRRERERSWGVVSCSLFNVSGKTPPPLKGWAEGRWDPTWGYRQPATEESIPPVTMVTSPQLGREASAKRMHRRERGGSERRREKGGVYDTSHNFDDPKSCLQRTTLPAALWGQQDHSWFKLCSHILINKYCTF